MLVSSRASRPVLLETIMRMLLLFFLICASALPVMAQEDEIVANLAGGRVLIHVTRDSIVFAAIDHPLESKSVPPRVAAIDVRHLGILFGASEWQVPAQPLPIRLDHDIRRVYAPKANYQPSTEVEGDLEQIGVGFLEKLRPLVNQLHHKIDLKPEEPLFEVVLLGYAPSDYGPEVWQIEYFVEQENVAAQGDYWQTHILRPRFTQLYPPEKRQPKTLVEVRFPETLEATPLVGLLQQNDPRVARVRGSDPHLNKIAELLERGEAQKADAVDAVDFLRAALPIVAGDEHFFLGNMSETGNFEWIIPPLEPVVKENTAEDKKRPPEAPSLRRTPKP